MFHIEHALVLGIGNGMNNLNLETEQQTHNNQQQNSLMENNGQESLDQQTNRQLSRADQWNVDSDAVNDFFVLGYN